jgi:hypothetical protein
MIFKIGKGRPDFKNMLPPAAAENFVNRASLLGNGCGKLPAVERICKQALSFSCNHTKKIAGPRFFGAGSFF